MWSRDTLESLLEGPRVVKSMSPTRRRRLDLRLHSGDGNISVHWQLALASAVATGLTLAPEADSETVHSDVLINDGNMLSDYSCRHITGFAISAPKRQLKKMGGIPSLRTWNLGRVPSLQSQ